MLPGGSARFDRLLTQLSEEHDLELKILQETNRQLNEEIQSLRSFVQRQETPETPQPLGGLREAGQGWAQVGIAVSPPQKHPLELEIEQLRDETVAASSFSTASPSQSLRVHNAAETTAVEVRVYSVQSLPGDLLEGESSPSKCRVSASIGLQFQATEWTVLNKEPGRPGECDSLWGAAPRLQ
ncbi:unnamed protein product [Symbiodinium natans]|uniref:Uncharacterized protein n=1 Tax=Symbiodinium natans TaxID=878477 RepID=A0A812MLQ2_9DINO|nr:unnamed protein product [Symbiodinium natans]